MWVISIFASWASSAPVNAQVNMSSYYEAVERGIPQNCSADFATAIKFFDASITGTNSTLISEIKNAVASAATGQDVPSHSTDSLDAASVGEYLMAPWGQFQTGIKISSGGEPVELNHSIRWSRCHPTFLRLLRDRCRKNISFQYRSFLDILRGTGLWSGIASYSSSSIC
jgi:hypothetical protein